MVVGERPHTVKIPSVTGNMTVKGGWSLMRVVLNEGFYCIAINTMNFFFTINKINFFNRDFKKNFN